MASNFLSQSRSILSHFSKHKSYLTPMKFNQVRNCVTTETGAYFEEPKKVSFGVLKVILTVIPGLYLGATISKEGAAFLEENDIFVPDDDDD